MQTSAAAGPLEIQLAMTVVPKGTIYFRVYGKMFCRSYYLLEQEVRSLKSH